MIASARRCLASSATPLATLLAASVAVSGCSTPEPAAERGDAPGGAAALGRDFDPLPGPPLGVEAARRAHQRAELRRHLRYLEVLEPRSFLDASTRALEQTEIDAGRVPLSELYELGRLLFEHEYSFADGLGSGRFARGPSGRQSSFRRVHEGRFGGPETTTCTSCHWRGGPAGGGGLQDNSFLYGDGDDVESADPRNPPSLQGVGVVEALAREMTLELAAIRTGLVRDAQRLGRVVERELTTKGIRFGVLRAAPHGTLDTSGVEGVDGDLVIKPFGWKGTFATLRDFVSESLQVHFGIQAEELVHRHAARPDPDLLGTAEAPDDPDGDGVASELTEGQLTALVAYLAMQEVPVTRPPRTLHDFEPPAENLTAPTATVFLDLWSRGRELFDDVGCASCHAPVLVLKNPVFRTRAPITGGVLEIDLSRESERPRLEYDPEFEGYPVRLFSDMKRHDLGEENAARHVDHGVPRELFLTRRLWGLEKSPPYFYNGHAPWFDHAIEMHGGEAAPSRTVYSSLKREEKAALRTYLLSLTRERRLIVP